jgi:predicted ATPase
MITRAHIRNFRCLVDVDLTFEPLTILVGPNASGKTSIIEALQPHQPLEQWPNGWRRTARPDVQVAVDGGSLVPRANARYGIQLLHLDVRLLRGENQLQAASVLDSVGSNLTNLFATLTRSEQNALVERFIELVPMYQDVVARPSSNGMHRLVFQDRWDSSIWYEPSHVSDGTILLFAFMALQYQPTPPDLLAIEEPERALHPYLIGELVAFLRQLATGKLGPRAVQVILATHSAELLDFAEPNEVRFVSRRSGDGATQVEKAPTGTEDWETAVKEYQSSLGGLWLSGSLGGVPGG